MAFETCYKYLRNDMMRTYVFQKDVSRAAVFVSAIFEIHFLHCVSVFRVLGDALGIARVTNDDRMRVRVVSLANTTNNLSIRLLMRHPPRVYRVRLARRLGFRVPSSRLSSLHPSTRAA